MTVKWSISAALLALVIAPVAVPAMAEEAVVDGVRFVIPDGTKFFMTPPNAGIVRGTDVQAVLDRNRAASARHGGVKILFTTTARDATPDVVLAVEPPADHPFHAQRARMRALPHTEGVAYVPKDVAPPDEHPLRWYSVATGLDYAPEAAVSCGPRSYGPEACLMALTLDGRLRLALRGFTVDETSPSGIRNSVVDAVTRTLPDGMRKH